MNRRATPFTPPSIIPIRKPRPIPEVLDLHEALTRYDQYLQGQFNDLTGPQGIINTGSQGAGTNIASASTISISDFLHNVTGTNVITTINPPLGFSAPTILFSQDGFKLGPGGNIVTPTPNPVQVPKGSYTQVVYHANVGMWKVTGLGGPVFDSVNTVTGPTTYTVAQTDFLVVLDATSGNVLADLPAATGSGRRLKFARVDNAAPTNTAGIVPSGSDTINGAGGTTFLSYQWVTIEITDYKSGGWLV